MSAPAEAERSSGGTAGAAGPWRAPFLALGAVLLAMAVAFRAEVAAAVGTWEASTAYNHCWLVLPVAAWLAWEWRGRLASIRPAPSWRLALLALPPAAAWLVAERLGIMEGRQLTALAMAEVAVLAVMGWRACRAMAAPLAYLVFLVPFGEFTVPVLQQVTAWMVALGLRALGISAYVDDLIIEIPEGLFYIAEACAGLRFIIASLAFGALYALTMFRSPWRRLLVMVLAVAVPVVANGFRALGIVALGHYLGSAEAAAADHVIYGWVFFSAVILLLTLAGLPFREDGAQRAAADRAAYPPVPVGRPVGGDGDPSFGALTAASVSAVLLACLGPAVTAGLGSGDLAPARVGLELAAPEGCVPEEGGALRCGGFRVTAYALVFPARTTWAAVSAARRSAERSDDEATTFRVPADGAEGGRAEWQGRQGAAAASRTMATLAWLDGTAAGDGLRSRALQGLNSLGLGRGRPVAAVAELAGDPGGAAVPSLRRGSEILREILLQQSVLVARAAELSRVRR